ncbi:MAG: hypothetical protein AB1790_03520 [Pseudomonadota bacterium]
MNPQIIQAHSVTCHPHCWRPACASALHLSLPLVFAGLLLPYG